MPEQKVINVSYPQKRKPLKIKPLLIAIGIIIIIGVVWALFFRPQPKQEEETQAEAEKQEEATTSAKPKEATQSAKPLDKEVDTSDWYEYKDVKETFSILVPKGWFFDKTLKGPREQGNVLGGVADFNITEKDFDPKENSAIYFEKDIIQSDISLKKYAARIACIRTNGGNCENPNLPDSQKSIKVAEKDSIWQEIHSDDEGVGIEVYVLKSEADVFVIYSVGMVDKIAEGFKIKQEFVDTIEGMLSTLKFLD